MDRPIAVLDSGVGGLTVVQELMLQLPRENIVYIGDTARCPYGSRPEWEIREFSLQLIRFLEAFNPKLIIIACNTATACILEEVSATSSVPVLGVIHPGVRAAIKATLTGRIGVIGTVGTIRSKRYEHALKQFHPDLYVISLACPSFVPLVEQGKVAQEGTREIVRSTLSPLIDQELDTLILGCTHYPLLAPVIRSVFPHELNLISSAEETAREVSTILYHQGLLSHHFVAPTHRFFASGDLAVFKHIAESWLGISVQVEKVNLEVIN